MAGHLHHGKTTLMDMLVEQTHLLGQPNKIGEKQMKFTDTRFDEQARNISIKMMPLSLVMQVVNYILSHLHLCDISLKLN